MPLLRFFNPVLGMNVANILDFNQYGPQGERPQRKTVILHEAITGFQNAMAEAGLGRPDIEADGAIHRFDLPPLPHDEGVAYIDHRLRTAGLAGGEVFADDAVMAIFKASKGTPRLVNILANKCLLAVFGEGGVMVKARHVRAAARDTEGAHRPWAWWGR